MSLAIFAEAARQTTSEVQGLTRALNAARRAGGTIASPEDTARAVERALDRRQAPGLIKKLQKELKKK